MNVILLPEIEKCRTDRAGEAKDPPAPVPSVSTRQAELVVEGSIGSALFRENARSGAELIGIADDAMYRAKRASRVGRPDSFRAAMGRVHPIA